MYSYVKYAQKYLQVNKFFFVHLLIASGKNFTKYHSDKVRKKKKSKKFFTTAPKG